MKYLSCLALCFLLVSCSPSAINEQYSSVGQDSRTQFIVLHYTATDLANSLRLLTQEQVSAHYLINDNPPTIYRLVDENNRAWHAGISFWQGRTFLNSSSIGIEMVNLGYIETDKGRQYQAWSEPQIEQLIVLLKNLVKQHNIKPNAIVGHNEIAPQRKQDPGPLFPWKRLADEGLIIWPDAGLVERYQTKYIKNLPNVLWFQERLAEVGYLVPLTGELDEETKNVISVFQMKYRPQNFRGIPDPQTAALLEALLAAQANI